MMSNITMLLSNQGFHHLSHSLQSPPLRQRSRSQRSRPCRRRWTSTGRRPPTTPSTGSSSATCSPTSRSTGGWTRGRSSRYFISTRLFAFNLIWMCVEFSFHYDRFVEDFEDNISGSRRGSSSPELLSC